MSSYRQIFKSTAIVGGAQIIVQGVNLLRQKAVTLLLGAEGFGIIGLFSSGVSIIGVITSFGINVSGVRQIAESSSSGDQEKFARTVRTLRVAALISGVLGMLITIGLCRQLSWVMFESYEQAVGFVLVGFSFLLSGISTGQIALLQGLRRLKEMASAQVAGAVLGSGAGVLVIYFMGRSGIPWFLIALTAASALVSWWFARRIEVPKPHMTAKDFATEARGLLGLGMAFMTSNLIFAGKDFLTRMWIVRDLSLFATGLYGAAWGLSVQYVELILGAMRADFTPRLTAVANDHPQANKLVNEQMELGVLLALPGVIATLAFAPWILHLISTSEFRDAAGLVRWLMIGNFLRVISWPLGMIIVAKGASRVFIFIEIGMGLLHVALIFIGMKLWKLEGVGVAFAILYVVSLLVNWILCRRMSGYTSSSRGRKIIGAASVIVVAGFLLAQVTNPVWSLGGGAALLLATSVGCYIGLRKLLQIDPWVAVMKKLGIRKS